MFLRNCLLIVAAASAMAAQLVSDSGGETLDRLIERALSRNGELLAARQRIAEMQGGVVQSRLKVNPSIEAGFASGRALNSRGESEFGIGYSHTFETGGKRDRRVEAAGIRVELATLEIADRERLLRADVQVRFSEALAAARNLASAEQLLELNRQSYQIAQARTREGEGTPLEEGLLRVEVNRIASDRLVFSNQIERAVLELKTLAGLEADEPLMLSGVLAAPKIKLAASEAVERALGERPDLRAARMEELLAAAEAKVARADATPDVVATARYSRSTARFEQYGLAGPGGAPVQIRDTDNLLSGGISITLPARNRNQGNIQSAAARERAASLRKQHIERAVRQEVLAAMRRYETAREALELFDQGVVRQSRENLRILRAAYELGEIRLMDVLNEQRRLIEAQRAYTDLLREAFLAAVEVERATGATVF
jgi:cobalt-zinc-cadmium efflux system outer membrane protein